MHGYFQDADKFINMSVQALSMGYNIVWTDEWNFKGHSNPRSSFVNFYVSKRGNLIFIICEFTSMEISLSFSGNCIFNYPLPSQEG